MFQQIVTQTNLYEVQQRKGLERNGRQWNPIDIHELLVWFGMTIVMSIVRFNRVEEYWEKGVDGAYVMQDYGRLMTLKRYQQIKRFMNCDDNSKAPKILKPESIDYGIFFQ